jgi:hypothetical protein
MQSEKPNPGSEAAIEQGCTWTLSDDPDCEFWETTCKRAFTMLEGTPKENEYDFCPGCGGKITEVPPPKGE